MPKFAFVQPAHETEKKGYFPGIETDIARLAHVSQHRLFVEANEKFLFSRPLIAVVELNATIWKIDEADLIQEYGLWGLGSWKFDTKPTIHKGPAILCGRDLEGKSDFPENMDTHFVNIKFFPPDRRF